MSITMVLSSYKIDELCTKPLSLSSNYYYFKCVTAPWCYKRRSAAEQFLMLESRYQILLMHHISVCAKQCCLLLKILLIFSHLNLNYSGPVVYNQ